MSPATARVLPSEEHRMFAGFLLAVLGLVSLWGARSWRRPCRQVTTWPVGGEQVTARHAIRPTDCGRTSMPAFGWAPDVRFTPRVGDIDYVGDTIWLPWSWTHTKASAEAFLATSPTRWRGTTIPRIPGGAACIHP